MFIVEIQTPTGPVCESFATYEEARRRIDGFPAESILGTPLLFQELPDGSQRFVREDGKPLQVHRLPDDRLDGPGDPIPLVDAYTLEPTEAKDDEEPPIPLV
jgi:hypothetical protein